MAEPDDKPADPPADAPPARQTAAQRAAAKRDQKLADVQEQIEEGRMTVRKLTPEEMEAHSKRREEIQSERAKRKR
jgi:hypothetical protein